MLLKLYVLKLDGKECQLLDMSEPTTQEVDEVDTNRGRGERTVGGMRRLLGDGGAHSMV